MDLAAHDRAAVDLAPLAREAMDRDSTGPSSTCGKPRSRLLPPGAECRQRPAGERLRLHRQAASAPSCAPPSLASSTYSAGLCTEKSDSWMGHHRRPLGLVWQVAEWSRGRVGGGGCGRGGGGWFFGGLGFGLVYICE
jgi:hypothetical protein